MNIMVLKQIRHNGIDYRPGEMINKITDKQAERLVGLKAAEYVSTVPIADIPEEHLDYNKMPYDELKQLVNDSGLTPESGKKEHLIAALEADDREIQKLIDQLKAKNITIPEEYTKEDLEKLLAE